MRRRNASLRGNRYLTTPACRGRARRREPLRTPREPANPENLANPRTSRSQKPRTRNRTRQPASATRNPEPSLLIRPDQPRLLDHVLLDRGEALLPVRARLQLDLRVERVEPEVIMMRP